MNEDNKRIAKNTMMLYFRMGISMVVSLFTARIVLNTLGVVDYGLFSVVGGVVSMFGFLNSAMSSGTQRFLTFELGRGNHEELKRVFSMSLSIHILIALIVLVLAETVGLWFLNTQMNIPADRMVAANWVYQFSVLAAMISLTQTPYSASIIAHERMSIYAYTGMADVVFRLLIIYLLVYIDFDKLKVYAVLTFAVSLLMALFYRWYCLRNFPETHFKVVKDRKLFKTLFNYAGWNLFGNLAAVLMGQGQNLLLNIFFGPVVNAAKGVGEAINGAIAGLVGNFQTASNPQIVKYYAAEEYDRFLNLVFRTSKIAFFLLLILAVPVLLETETIYKLWLGVPPDHSVLFCKLVIINSLINSVSYSLMTASQASGNIKFYQSFVGGILLLNFPLSYLFLKLGLPPQSVYWVSILLSILSLAGRLYILKGLVRLPLFQFIGEICVKCTLVAILSYFPLTILLPLFTQGIFRLFAFSFVSVLFTSFLILFIGFTKQERNFILTKAKSLYLSKIRRCK